MGPYITDIPVAVAEIAALHVVTVTACRTYPRVYPFRPTGAR